MLQTQALVGKTGRPLLERRLHTDFGSEILFYDDEFGLAASLEHAHAAHYLADCLRRVAKRSRLEWLVDNPVWYWADEHAHKQKAYFSDIGLAKAEDSHRVTADELLFILEVVTTSHKRKEHKDTVINKARNAEHGVGEFVLY